MTMQITEHFVASEFDQPARHGFAHEAYPPFWYADRLTPLCKVLEVIRSAVGGKPIKVISGYRDPSYNEAINGKPHSQHMAGRAADIVIADGTVTAQGLHSMILALYNGGDIMIGGLFLYGDFVHVDVREQRPTGHLAQGDFSGDGRTASSA